MQQLSPLFLFSRVGEFCADRFPYVVPRDRALDSASPCAFAVGPDAFDEALREVFGYAGNGQVGPRARAARGGAWGWALASHEPVRIDGENGGDGAADRDQV